MVLVHHGGDGAARVCASGIGHTFIIQALMALHREIESRGRVLSALLNLCERLASPGAPQQPPGAPQQPSGEPAEPPAEPARAHKSALRLYKRWQILYLKNFEWILHLESSPEVASSSSSSESSCSELCDAEDEEVTPPCKKQRLLSAMSPELLQAEGQHATEPMDLETHLYAHFNKSGRSKVANSAVFYYKHSTTEQSNSSEEHEEEEDEEEWTFTAASTARGVDGARTRLNFDGLPPPHAAEESGEASEETSGSPSSPHPLDSDCSSEDLHTSVATCIGQSPEKVVMRPKRSPQRVKRRPVSLPFSLLSPESPLACTPTSKTCSDTNLASLSRKKRTMRRSKRRLQQASQSSESEDLMSRLAALNEATGIVRSSSFSGVRNLVPMLVPDGSHSEPSCRVVRRRRCSSRLAVPATKVRDLVEEHGEPSWDGYQERYNSEAYSEEPMDSETARKLLEFGDDYSRYLREELSDCSLTRRPLSQTSSSRRRRDCKVPPADSDSEVEELRYVLKLSQESLAYTSQRLHEATAKFNALVTDMRSAGAESILNVGELSEMAATCRESRKCVALVISKIEHDSSGVADLQLIYELLEQWEDLEAQTQELQRASVVARQVAALRHELSTMAAHRAELSLAASRPRHPQRAHSRLTLQIKMAAIRDQLAVMTAIKPRLSDVSLLVHRLDSEDTFSQQIKSMLKVQTADLYEIWEHTNTGLESELSRSKEHLAAWEELDRQLLSLRGSLLRDRELLLSGARTKELSDCGSLSDSGISDAGSDVLEAREKELTTLRALANQLPPHTRQDIAQELDAAERELEQLRLYSSQRNLATVLGQPYILPSRPRSPRGTHPCGKGKGEGEGGRPPYRRWFRLMPLCLVALLAVALTLLQPPNCCEYVTSGPVGRYWQQLRFHNGPPPV